MPIYEFRCAECDTRFEARLPVAMSGSTPPCPEGHESTRRILSVFATAGRSDSAAPGGGFGGSGGGGGCGPGCACAHG